MVVVGLSLNALQQLEKQMFSAKRTLTILDLEAYELLGAGIKLWLEPHGLPCYRFVGATFIRKPGEHGRPDGVQIKGLLVVRNSIEVKFDCTFWPSKRRAHLLFIIPPERYGRRARMDNVYFRRDDPNAEWELDRVAYTLDMTNLSFRLETKR